MTRLRFEPITWLASPPLANHVAVFVSCHALQTERPRCFAWTLNNLLVLIIMRAASAAHHSAQHRFGEFSVTRYVVIIIPSFQPPSRAFLAVSAV